MAASRQSLDLGLPLVRPLVLMHPSDPNTYEIDFEYYLGADLLVVPTFFKEGVQRLYLPHGHWRSLFHPEQYYQGKRWHTLQSPPFNEILCFVKEDATLAHLLPNLT